MCHRGRKMILVRHVFQAKYGRGDEVVKIVKELSSTLEMPKSRVMTDHVGEFFTIVHEIEVPSLAVWESEFGKAMANPKMAELGARMNEAIKSGRRELYTIVS